MTILTANMETHSEGIRRLSIFCGAIAAVVWVAFVLAQGPAVFSEFSGLVIFVTGIFVCFFAVLFLVRGAGWVVQGFRSDR